MRYSATEIIRRGFDSMLANWQLLLIRVAEAFVWVAVIFASIIAAIVPIVLSVAGGKWPDLRDAQNAPEVVAQMVLSHAPLILFLFLLLSVVLLVLVAVHAFVDGGSARIYIDAEFSARAVEGRPPRTAWRAFSGDRWLLGAKRGWWPIFWIYNVAWSVAMLILLVPLLAVLAVIVIGGVKPAAIILGCVLLFVTIFLLFFVGIVTGIWCQKAIIVCVARTMGAMDSLREAWVEVRSDFTRHFTVAFVLMMISFGTAMLVSFLSIGVSMGARDPGMAVMLMPLRLAAQFASNAVSLMVAAWMTASFAALTIDR